MRRFVQKDPVLEGVQWSGSNWHSVLDFCGRDGVSTDGKDIFLHMGGEPKKVEVGHWLLRDEGKTDGIIVALSEEALREGWDELSEDLPE